MSEVEARATLLRAVEGGYFDEAFAAWIAATFETPEFDRADEAVVALASALLGQRVSDEDLIRWEVWSRLLRRRW